MSYDRYIRYISRIATRLAAAMLSLFVLAACKGSDLLEQEAPSRVLANTLEDPRNAQLLVTSTIADFECALAHYILSGGLVGDELRDAQLGAAGWDHDRRTINPVGGVYATNTCLQAQFASTYTPLATARFTADDVLRKLEGWTDAQVAGRQDLIAQAAAYAGYSLVLLGEGFCSMAIDAGPELTPQQVFTQAEARFTKAITAATTAGNTSIKMMAYVGRARTRLDKGDKVGARADAAQVTDPTFVKTATYSASTFRRENRVWDFLFRGAYATIDDPFRNVTVPSASGPIPDPRVASFKRVSGGADVKGQDGGTTIWATNKYPLISTPIPIAKYAEAQLIIAEVDLGQSAVGIINNLRARAGLTAASNVSGTTDAEILALVIDERRRELFLEGQRLYDIIRFQLPLYPAVGARFTADIAKGGTYGTQVCFPLPDVERINNPNIKT
jgi:hypothetical protein